MDDEPYEIYESHWGFLVEVPIHGIKHLMTLKTAKEVYSKLADAIARMQESKTNNERKDT